MVYFTTIRDLGDIFDLHCGCNIRSKFFFNQSVSVDFNNRNSYFFATMVVSPSIPTALINRVLVRLARGIYNSWRLHASFEEARGACSLRTGWFLTSTLWMKRSSGGPAIVKSRSDCGRAGGYIR